MSNLETVLLFEINIPTVSELNVHEHWAVRSKRRRRQREAVAEAWAKVIELQLVDRPRLPLVVTLTRIGKRKLDKHDNLRSAFKSIVDEIAHQLGINDNDTRIEWIYRQEPGEPGIRVLVQEGSLDGRD